MAGGIYLFDERRDLGVLGNLFSSCIWCRKLVSVVGVSGRHGQAMCELTTRMSVVFGGELRDGNTTYVPGTEHSGSYLE